MKKVEPTSRRRVSPVANLDRETVRELCDLHPWGLGRLCEQVGVDRTVLSHFFAGRRPFPKKYAVAFLAQLGMRVSGELDPEHGFAFRVRPGQTELAIGWVRRLFPQGGKKVLLSNWMTQDPLTGEGVPPRDGAILTGNGVALLLVDESGERLLARIQDGWELVDENFHADDWLDPEYLPTKAGLLAAANVVHYEDLVWNDDLWDEVKREVIARSMTAEDVLLWLAGQPIRSQLPLNKALRLRSQVRASAKQSG